MPKEIERVNAVYCRHRGGTIPASVCAHCVYQENPESLAAMVGVPYRCNREDECVVPAVNFIDGSDRILCPSNHHRVTFQFCSKCFNHQGVKEWDKNRAKSILCLYPETVRRQRGKR